MFRILSLDGGGIRGAFIAAFLARLQENLDEPLVDHFDLIAGTSTGGLVAVALGMGLSPQEIRDIYKLEGPSIFKRPARRVPILKERVINVFLRSATPTLDAEWLLHAKYDGVALNAALEQKLGKRLLGESQCRLVIPAVDLASGKIVVFKTPHRPNFIRDRYFRAVDVVLATTAAPSYFPIASIEVGSAYCDGGIWANNPSLVGYVEAIKISKECVRKGIDEQFTQESIRMLSVGTGRAAYFVTPGHKDLGVKSWAPVLLNVSGESQSEGIHWQMDYLLGERYSRIDFDIPAGDWDLDSISNIDALLHIGSQKAIESFQLLRGKFFERTASCYTPFDA